MGDGLKNLTIFKKLGFDENSQWLLYKDSCKHFFNWIATNVSEDNILSEAEISEYNYLKREKKVLNDGEIEKELILISDQYPNILKYNEKSIKLYEDKLEEVTIVENEFKEIIAELKICLKQADEDLFKLEKQIDNLQYNENLLYKQTLNYATTLEELEIKNKQSINELNQYYSKNYSPPLFLHQMPIDEYNIKCEQYGKYIGDYIKKKFNVKEYNDEELDIDNNLITQEMCNDLNEIEKRILKAEQKYMQENLEINGVKSIIKGMDGFHWQPLSYSNMTNETREFIDDCDIMKIRIETIETDIEILLKKLTSYRIENILYENTKTKYNRAITRLNNLKIASYNINNILLGNDLLWMLMQIDYNKIKEYYDITNNISPLNRKCLNRIDLMKNLSKMNAIHDYNHIIERYQTILLNSNNNNNTTIENYLEYYNQMINDIKSFLNDINNKSYYDSIINNISELKENENFLKTYVFCGLFKKPQLIKVNYMKSIFIVKENKKLIEQFLTELQKNFRENCVEPYYNDKYFRYKQLLWIWFLTEPMKVILAIKDITQAASVKKVSCKTSGIRRAPSD